MAGFVPTRRVIRLQFAAGSGYDGLEVDVRSVSVAGLFSMTDAATLANIDPGRVPTPEDMAKFKEVCRQFAAVIDRWNVETDDGRPVPATYEALVDQDPVFVLDIVRAWIDAAAGKNAPTPDTGAAAPLDPATVAEIPMEVLAGLN